MYTILSKSKVALLACLVAIAFTGVASAFPSKGGGCNAAGCHGAGGGSMSATPNPLNVQLSSSGLLTFDVSSVPADVNTAINVQFADATVFNNVSSNGGNLTWTKRTSGGNGFTSSNFTTAGSYTLSLLAGAAAPVGSSALTLWISSGGPVTTQYTGYSLNITNAIPEPATLGLFCLGGVVTLFRRGRRA